MGDEITMYVTIAVSLVFGVLYVVCILMFFGQAGIMVAGYNFEPTAPEAKKLHKRIMRRFALGIFVVCLFIHGTIVAFLYAGDVAGGVLAGVSAAVLVGTLYPVFYDMLGLGTLTVGAPYFNSFFAPMTLFAAVAAGGAQILASKNVKLTASVCAVVALGCGTVAFATDPKELVMTFAAFAAAGWLVATSVASIVIRGAGRPSFGAVLAHAAIAVAICRISLSFAALRPACAVFSANICRCSSEISVWRALPIAINAGILSSAANLFCNSCIRSRLSNR